MKRALWAALVLFEISQVCVKYTGTGGQKMTIGTTLKMTTDHISLSITILPVYFRPDIMSFIQSIKTEIGILTASIQCQVQV